MPRVGIKSPGQQAPLIDDESRSTVRDQLAANTSNHRRRAKAAEPEQGKIPSGGTLAVGGSGSALPLDSLPPCSRPEPAGEIYVQTGGRGGASRSTSLVGFRLRLSLHASEYSTAGACCMTNLDSSDPWIAANSPLPADKLHAIGVIAFRWNRCELGLFLLLSAVAKLPRRDVWAMTHDLGDMAMCDRVRTFALFRGYHPDGMTLISNALTIYDRCRQNRNSIIHAWTISVGRDPPLARKSKKGSDPEPIPLPSAISELRRVADEIATSKLDCGCLIAFLLIERTR